MTNPVVIMVTVSNRVKFLNDFMRTLVERQPGIPIHVHLQDPDHRAGEIEFPKGLDHSMTVTGEPIGCHAARVLALRQIEGQGFDAYINCDDDVLLTELTNWMPAVEYAAKEGVGFVLTNWVRSASIYAKFAPRVAHTIGQRILVYNGGGMAYREDVANMMRALDPGPARFDDIWPMTTYLSGRMNYVYYGSLSIHNTLSKGGMRKYMADEPRPLLCWDWIDYPPLQGARVGVEYGIGADANVKPSAKAAHLAARKAKGWSLSKTGKRAGTPELDPLPELVH